MPDIKIDKVIQDAEIEDDTILYRITSPAHSSQNLLLNGQGARWGEGRFHRIHQFTSYVSNNVLVCLAEKLYHMSRVALKELETISYKEFKNEASKSQHLVVFKVDRIDNLVYLDSSQAVTNYRVTPSTVLHPDQIYSPLQTIADRLRSQNKNGIVYPSARHSEGLVVALFLDQTSKIKSVIGRPLEVRLSLVNEDLSLLVSDSNFDPSKEKLSHSVGHFSFDANDFTAHQSYLSPAPSVTDGYIDFLRISYSSYNSRPYRSGFYPDHAIR